MLSNIRLSRSLLLLLAICLVLILTQSPILNANDSESTVESQTRTQLFENLLAAENEAAGRQAEGAVWKYWFDQAPSVEARGLLDAGIKRREAYDYESAEHLFDELIKIAPAYSEAFNQRAFIRFLREDHTNAQSDLEKALTLEPLHFGALAGIYQIHMIQNRPKAGFRFLQQAVEIHPWLRERSALPKSMQPAGDQKKDTGI